MKKVAVEAAVGLPLGHDITEIVAEKKIKRRAFRRGHVIRAADVERLRDLGKSAVYIVEPGDTDVHEDDAAAAAMADAGVDCVVKGMPVQPGNNFTIGYRDGTPVCAVPAATLFFRTTALDLCLPRLLAGERLTADFIARLGHGGLAQPGAEDHFPDCTFGHGG